MLWIKCFHVLGVMAWMAGIFYLPRIFVHYAEGQAEGEDVRRLVIMAERLYGFMTLMALARTGAGRVAVAGVRLCGTVAAHQAAAGARPDRLSPGVPLFRAAPAPKRSHAALLALRLFNEAGLLLVVPILIMAIVKPTG